MTHTARAPDPRIAAPLPEAFPEWPSGWYFAVRSNEVRSNPAGIDLFGRRLVCYRAAGGHPVVMDARCWHMGADLSMGSIVDGRIVCPFHGWQYGKSGKCEFIPAQAEIPPCAQQQRYQTAERDGRIFVFPAARAQYAFPFFADTNPGDLISSPPFEFIVNCPWWLVGANGFDVQHFASAHDRRLLDKPILQSPHPSARRIITTFEVCGQGWRDRLTRTFAGPRVTMDVSVWSGTLVFVIARFHGAGKNSRGTTSYGMTEICPLVSAPAARSLVRVTIFRRRRQGMSALDRIDVRVKRLFIRAFLRPDTSTLDGARYDPDHLIHADVQMINYLRWLVTASRGALTRKEP